MSNPNQGFSQRWFDEVWNNRREAAIDELRHPGGRAFGFPATQRKVSFSGSSFMHLHNGKLHDAWNFFDFTAVVHELRGN